MFGLIKSQKSFKWAFFGKLPIAGDYLTIGRPTPLLVSFAKWVEKGYFEFAPDKNIDLNFSWRFWAKGPNKELVCGIIKSSADKFNRQYPLLIIGSGKELFLNKNWAITPYACDKTWEQLELITQNHVGNIRDIKRSLKMIRPPVSEASELNLASENIQNLKIEQMNTTKQSDFLNKMNSIESLSRLKNFTVQLDEKDKQASLASIIKLLFLLKKKSSVAPNVVFWGGNKDSQKLFFLKRALNIADFQKFCEGL